MPKKITAKLITPKPITVTARALVCPQCGKTADRLYSLATVSVCKECLEKRL